MHMYMSEEIQLCWQFLVNFPRHESVKPYDAV